MSYLSLYSSNQMPSTSQHHIVLEDYMGQVSIPSDKLWGAQTQRSIQNFDICRNTDIMPIQIVRALAVIKKAAARVNIKFGLDPYKAQLIEDVCDQIIAGNLDSHFPLVVWQTGSGTQSNMNVNQVIANRAKQLITDIVQNSVKIHPNNDVNMGQSSNDCFPTAMHIATVLETHRILLPALKNLADAFKVKVEQFKDVIKIGRTHMQDATPITLGQQFSGYHQQIKYSIERIEQSLQGVHFLAQGGSAVGTGLNTFESFDVLVAQAISQVTGIKFQAAPNKFQALATHDALTYFHSSLNNLAVSLMKIANDIRFLGSGPRAGLGELLLPENEPGSSIMPGKINPTQCQALTMVCAQVMGNNVAVAVGASNGHFELNVFKPLIIRNVLHSIQLLGEGCNSFRNNCLVGIKYNPKKIKENLEASLMVVTALAPILGYDLAGKLASKANKQNLSLRQAFMGNQDAKDIIRKKYFSGQEATQEQIAAKYQELVDPSLMLAPTPYKS